MMLRIFFVTEDPLSLLSASDDIDGKPLAQ